MADYTADAYAHRGVVKAKGAGSGNYGHIGPNEGQQSKRFQIKPGDEISGGEIWVNKDTTIAASDTLTVTVKAI